MEGNAPQVIATDAVTVIWVILPELNSPPRAGELQEYGKVPGYDAIVPRPIAGVL